MVLERSAEQYLKARRDEGVVDVASLSPAEARALERTGRQRYGEGPAVELVEDWDFPCASGHVRLRLLSSVDNPAHIVVYFHGGGWVVGELEDYEALLRTLANETDSAVVIVEYRKAPEHPFPAAVHDAIAAVTRVDRLARARFSRYRSLIVAGDSAGGNLAAVVAQAVPRGQVPPLQLQILIYPVLDCDFTTPSYTDPANQLLLTRETMEWFWDQYVPAPWDRLHPMASPARAESLVGLPPALLVTAQHDVLRSEAERYANRLHAAGVAVEHVEFDGQMHGFFSLHNVLPASEKARHLIAAAIRNQGREHGEMS